MAVALAAAACTASISGPDGEGGGLGPDGNNPGGPSNMPNGAAGSGSLPAGASGKLKLTGNPLYLRTVRLTNDQWTRSVQGALGLAAPPTQAEGFQSAVPGMTDFTTNELLLSMDGRTWSDYQAAAEALAAQVTSDPAALANLYSGTDAAGFIAKMGRRLFRRPLAAEETTAYQALFDKGTASTGTQSTFAKGAALVLEAMLQSPNFLYRTELGAPGAALSGYELAAKLSLWLRDAGPDDALLDKAGSGGLDTVEGLVAVATQMLEEPATKTVMRKFHNEFLHFGKFASLSKVGVPEYDPSINDELWESSHLFFERIFTQNLGVRDIFSSTKGFAGPKMAALYGTGAGASGIVEVETGRAGFFQQLPFLMLYANNAAPDSIHRGVSMSLDVLCAPLGIFAGELPPLPPRQPGQTNRMRVDAHTKGCGTVCHNNMINPLGFAFDNYDGMGRYREVETYPDETLPIDASGSFEFVEGRKSYTDAADLMRTLATDQQAHLCYSKKLAGYALQRDIVEADGGLLAELAKLSTSSSGSVKQILINLVKQPAFRTRAGGVQ
jgi:hypothetical protein